ncbi:hypothetical protein GN316_13195 [Xylophilus sp. Kf1]|nr:hypothetical protein [Xylophilus sp. Kf1]
MTNLSITLTVLAAWLGLGFVFLSLCRAAGRADDQADMARQPRTPRTLKQHIFAVHARTLRSMRRTPAAHGSVNRGSLHRHADHHNGFHSA